MKLPDIVRPEFEIKYKNIIGFMWGVICAIRFGIRKFNANIVFEFGGIQHRFWIIPKYKFIKVSKMIDEEKD